jgi:nitrous oxide reductase accessory protein NosL
MYRNLISICCLSLLILGATVWTAVAQNDIDDYRSCAHCGMDRKGYGYSRMLVVYGDGGKVGVCSLHCAVTELGVNRGRTVASLLVADRGTRLLINAEKAFWVMGGSKRGVMTKHPAWAFATKASAEAFIASYGGKLTGWDEVLAAAKQGD